MSRATWARLTALCALALATTACATLPQPTKVQDFGAAVSTTAGIFREAVSANRALAIRANQESQAQAYIRRRPYTLTETGDYTAVLVKADAQLAALAALEQYGKAITLAADQGVVDKLEQASVRLGEAAGGLVIAASPVAIPVAGPALKLTSRGVGFLLGNAYAGEIQAVLVARNASVKKLAEELDLSLEALGALLGAQLDQFEIERMATLDVIRRDRRVDALRLDGAYRTARTDLEGARALLSSLAKYKAALRALTEAHDALAKGEGSSEVAVRRFVALANDLADVLKAVRAAQ